MSEVADKLCAAIRHEGEKQRQQVLVSIKIDLSIPEAERLVAENKIHDKSFQYELKKRMTGLLHHINPNCDVRFPVLEAGHLNCFAIDYTNSGRVIENLIAEAFAFPQESPRKEPK